MTCRMGCCISSRRPAARPVSLFRHTSLVDEDNNFYIDTSKPLGTLAELDEDVVTVTSEAELA